MEKYEDLPIGIDLGTTFSCIGVYRNASVEIIPNEKGERTTPSIVSFLDDYIYVGEQTEYKRLKDQKNKIYAVKRIIGRNFDDKEVQEDINKFSYIVQNDKGRPQIVVNSNGTKMYSPEEISAKILNKLKKSAESFLQQSIKKVVITVPAYFTERQKQATKNAGEIAGLDVIKIINEPTAASLAYGFGRCQNIENKLLGKKIFTYNNSTISYRMYNTENSNDCKMKNDSQKTENILVFDLGGGTLDVTLLELEKDDITVKAHSGRMHLGGEDFDNILTEYCINYFKKKTKIDLNKEEFIKPKYRLKEHCEKAKRELSYKNEVEIEVESIANGKDFYLKITKAKFEEICKDIFDLCLQPVIEVLKDSNENKNNVDEIVLIGGSTRIPKIQTMLKEFFNGKEVNKKLNPDEAVAYGATIEAAIIMGQYAEDITLLDVCPFSLGIAVEKKNYFKEFGLLMKKVIKKGTSLPYKLTELFHPVHENPSSLLIQIYEGESNFIKDNYPLGKFELLDIPKKKKEDINIDITFELDEDSILTVTAVIRENNCKNSIIIKNDKGGLSKNEIEIAKEKQKNETIGENLGPAILIERNYKGDINKLINKINNSTKARDQFYYLQSLKTTIETFIETLNKEISNNITFKEKMYYYLSLLFNTYSLILNYSIFLSEEEKSLIISKVCQYLEFFKNEGTSYCPSLVKIFYNNEDEIFGEFCIQIIGYYSNRGTLFYSNNEKHYAKHYLEEALSINKKYSVKKRVENNSELCDRLYSIIDNCNELINILKAESIEKYCKSFSRQNLIKEDEFTNDEQKIDILDRFKDALRLLENPKKKEDKLLKAIYLANIVKIEYKFFKSNDYDTLLKMIESCIELKLQVPYGCDTTNMDWFTEICQYKTEIEEKIEKIKENPKEEQNKIKNDLIEIIDEINKKYQNGKTNFFYYILSEHKPNGLDTAYQFNNLKDLEYTYNIDRKGFLKKLKKLYNPIRYRGDKEEEQKIHLIMREISMKLNTMNNNQ